MLAHYLTSKASLKYNLWLPAEAGHRVCSWSGPRQAGSPETQHHGGIWSPAGCASEARASQGKALGTRQPLDLKLGGHMSGSLAFEKQRLSPGKQGRHQGGNLVR